MDYIDSIEVGIVALLVALVFSMIALSAKVIDTIKAIEEKPVEVPEVEPPKPELVWTSFVRVWICEECETPYKMDPAYSSEVTLCGICGSEEIRQSIGRWKHNPHNWSRTGVEEFEERKS